MGIVGALTVGLVLLAACNYVSCDEIEFRDRMMHAGELSLNCVGPDGPIELRSWAPTGASIVSLPSHYSIGQKRASCYGHYTMSAESFGFDVYTYERDHVRCRNRCILEARRDALYGTNSTTGGWDLVSEYPFHDGETLCLSDGRLFCPELGEGLSHQPLSAHPPLMQLFSM